MIDYMTPAMRLAPHAEHRNCRTLAEANAYLDARGISVLRHGFTPTKACDTDVQRTIVRAMQERINQDCARFMLGVPSLLRRQAA